MLLLLLLLLVVSHGFHDNNRSNFLGMTSAVTSLPSKLRCYCCCTRSKPRNNTAYFEVVFFFVVVVVVVVVDHHFYFPAQLVGGFTLSDLLDKPWSQVSSLLPPGTYLQFLSRIGLSIPTARRFSSNVANSCSRAFR